MRTTTAFLSILLAVFAVSLWPVQSFAFEQGDKHEHRKKSYCKDDIRILSPKPKEELTAAPVQVTLALPQEVNPISLKVVLNGKDVSSRFSVGKKAAEGMLDIADGLKDGPQGNPGDSTANHLKVSGRSKDGKHRYVAHRQFFVDVSDTGQTVVATIPATGGQIDLPGVGSVSFPAGAFDGDHIVEMAKTVDPDTAADFEEDVAMFGAGASAGYEVRVKTGNVAPNGDINVTLEVPEAFRASVPAGHEVRTFALNIYDDGNERLESFELFGDRFTAQDETISFVLPVEFFGPALDGSGNFEAVVVIGSTPTAPDGTAQPVMQSLSTPEGTGLPEVEQLIPADATRTYSGQIFPSPATISAIPTAAATTSGTCLGSTLGPPLGGSLEVTSSFGPRSGIPGSGNFHRGTDLRAADGTEVLSMADGVIEAIGVERDRTTGAVKGWGQFVRVLHSDGSRTLYAHLTMGSATKAVGQPVAKGEVIALSDTTGLGTGPHLHIEYVPNGKVFERDSKVDPWPCIGAVIPGSVTIGDNGALADDSFRVYINGVLVCTTAIGAYNNCAVSNLRPGTATLSVNVLYAPDDVGTYVVALTDGLTFEGGGISRSAAPPQGATDTYTIIIPATTQ